MTPQPPLTDANRRKALKIAERMVRAHDSGSQSEARRYARQLAKLGVQQVSLKPKE